MEYVSKYIYVHKVYMKINYNNENTLKRYVSKLANFSFDI